jgi:sarcosine oxidase/L-pipecolate oxidase
MQNCISRSGVVVLGFPEPSPGATIQGDLVGSYSRESYNNDLAIGADVTLLETPDALRSAFPSSTPVASLDSKTGYLNKDGGWADAGKGLKRMINRVTQMGATIISGKEVKELVKELIKDGTGFKTIGVRCSDGSQYDASLVVSALGSWTPSTFPGLNFNGACLAAGWANRDSLPPAMFTSADNV